MHQSLQGATFDVEHIIPRTRGGPSLLNNLAWACPSCNLHKSNRVLIPSPGSGEMVSLFNPRTDDWHDHFRRDEYAVIGRTSIGRATVKALALNDDRRIKIRQAEALFNLFPPNDDE
jgi:hypothetical protein